MKRTGGRIAALVCALGLLFSLSACSSMFPSSVTDLDTARIVDQQVMESWETLAETYNDAWDRCEDLRPWLEENAKPALENALKAVNAYHNAVMMWSNLGDEYDDVGELYDTAKSAISHVWSILSSQTEVAL